MFLQTRGVARSDSSHPLGVKVLLDCEAVNNAGGREAALDARQQDEQQGQLGGRHRGAEKQTHRFNYTGDDR